MTTFNLSITLHPATVHSGDDVQRALALTGAEIANRYDGLTLPEYLTGIIRDGHGNAVGTWSTGDAASTEGDGSIHAAVIDALEDRRGNYDLDDDEGVIERLIRAVAWIEDEPDAFWEEFAGPLLDDIEAKFS